MTETYCEMASVILFSEPIGSLAEELLDIELREWKNETAGEHPEFPHGVTPYVTNLH